MDQGPHIVFVALTLVTVGFSPMAAAHWDDTSTASDSVPAHHVTTIPGGMQAFDFPPLICASNSGTLTVVTHIGYNVAEANWHAAVSNGAAFSAYDPGTVPPDGPEGVDLPGLNDTQIDSVDQPPYLGPDLHTPNTTTPHGHHDAGDVSEQAVSPASENGNLVDSFTDAVDDHLAITAGGGRVLVAVDVVNADDGGHPTPSAPGFHLGGGDIGVSIPVQDTNPQNGVEDCPANHNGIPAGNDQPTGARASAGTDTSVEPTLPSQESVTTGSPQPTGLPATDQSGYPTNGPCIDVGDQDADTAVGGAFLLYDEDVPTPPAATGFNIGGCQMPPGFIDQAGESGAVRMRDAVAPPNGAPYTVCFDLNDDGMCTTNSQATPDAWDRCRGGGNIASDVLAVSHPLGDKSPANPSGFFSVGNTVGFFGESHKGAGEDCWPRKGVSGGGGPSYSKLPAPAAGDYNPPDGVTYAELVVFTPVCYEDEDSGAPLHDTVTGNADPNNSNECGTGADNIALNSQTWFVVHDT